MRDYGTGFLMAGVALIVSALFLLLLHQMNRKIQGEATNNQLEHRNNQYDKAEEKEEDMT